MDSYIISKKVAKYTPKFNEYLRASICNIATLLSLMTIEAALVFANLNSKMKSVVLYLISMFVQYTLDILFAKTYKSTYTANRFKWYFNSFTTSVMSRFLVYTILHYLIQNSITQNFHKLLDKYDLKHKYRNIVLSFIINALLFTLYGYYIKFKWAYSENADPFMTILILAWCTLSIMLYTLYDK